jgi:hypothetical protein
LWRPEIEIFIREILLLLGYHALLREKIPSQQALRKEKFDALLSAIRFTQEGIPTMHQSITTRKAF